MKKLNNKGFSLVEIIVAITISAFVIIVLTTFMRAGTNNFKQTNDEVQLQSQAQTSMNQIKDFVINADSVKVYGAYGTVYEKAVVILHDDFLHILYYQAANQQLYYVKMSRSISGFLGSEAEVQAMSTSLTENVFDKKNLMAQYVSEFQMDTDIYDPTTGAVTGKSVTIHMTIRYHSKEYPVDSKVTLRNNPI